MNDTMDKFKQYISLEGKAGRQEYWAIILVCYFILTFFGSFTSVFLFIPSWMILRFLVGSFMLALFAGILYVMFAVAYRRCKDIGINSWFALTLLIPTINIIAIIVFGLLPKGKENEPDEHHY
jgi:uncharacterized membrane protein YhaH (DUF805 family)